MSDRVSHTHVWRAYLRMYTNSCRWSPDDHVLLRYHLHSLACTYTYLSLKTTTAFQIHLEPKLQLTSSIADTPLLFGIMRHNSIFKSLDRDRGYDFHPPTGMSSVPMVQYLVIADFVTPHGEGLVLSSQLSGSFRAATDVNTSCSSLNHSLSFSSHVAEE
uniref:Uncharacterized protein n=1 Tax=Physcomitrium patens TaxID=3218 RepID=A0A2K1LBN9_PHYPA|nr:hypothetical protein PHYPA_001863 [Physcomitrium patens]